MVYYLVKISIENVFSESLFSVRSLKSQFSKRFIGKEIIAPPRDIWLTCTIQQGHGMYRVRRGKNFPLLLKTLKLLFKWKLAELPIKTIWIEKGNVI